MFEDKINAAGTLRGTERRRLRRAYRDGDSNRSSRLRIFLLALLAVIAVMLVTQALLQVGGSAGDRLAADIFGRPA